MLCAGVGTRAQSVAFDNFGPDNSFDTSSGLVVENGALYGDVDQAHAFVAEASGRVSSVALAAGYLRGVNALDVTLHADGAGAPGDVLETWHVTDAIPPYTDPNRAPLELSASGTTSLVAGLTYWLVASVPGAESTTGWNLNSVGDVGLHAHRTNLGPWIAYSSVRAAVRVMVESSVAADFDEDGDVDLSDFGYFLGCYNGPNHPPAQSGCEPADLDDDGDADLADFGLFLPCFNGPDRPPACTP